MTWYREWFGEEYIQLYSYRDEQEARQQAAFFSKQFGELSSTVLDLACGGGRHLQELNALGYRVVGCDLSYVLLRSGRDEYGEQPITRADMRQLPFCNGTFGALVSFFTSFGYFATEEENRQVVREMARVLESGAVFLFDYLNVHHELAKLVERECRDTPMGKVIIEKWFDPSDRSFNKRIAVGEKRFLERVRGYDLEEISSMFSDCDLAIRNVFGDFDGRSYDRGSRRLILVGTKER